jgi:hypothetical protein
LRVATIDQGYVRASLDRVYELVSNPGSYPTWWPRVRRDGARLRFPTLGSVACSTDVVEEGIDLRVPVDGPRVRGHLQWHLKEFGDGTIVYAALDVETRRRWSVRRVLRHRSSVRRALVGLKRLEAR